MRSSRFPALIAILGILFGAPAILRSEDVLEDIMLDVGEQSIFPRIAVDNATGTSAIVWTNYDYKDPLRQRAYIVFIVPGKNNSGWKILNIRELSPKGEHASVAFNPATNEFLVVWDTRIGGHVTESREILFATDGGAKLDGDIQARLYSLKGKRRSKTITYNNYGSCCQNPIAFYNPAEGNYICVWQGKGNYPFHNPDLLGVFAARVNERGDRVGDTKRLWGIKQHDRGYLNAYPIAGAVNVERNCILVLTGEDVPLGVGIEGTRYCAYKLDLNCNLTVARSVTHYVIGTSSWYAGITGTIDNKSKFHYLSWAESGILKVGKVSARGMAIKGTRRISKAGNAWATSIAYCPERKCSLVVHDAVNGVFARFVDEKGYIKPKRITISRYEGAGRPSVVWNNAMGRFMAVWIERGEFDTVMLTTIKPPKDK